MRRVRIEHTLLDDGGDDLNVTDTERERQTDRQTKRQTDRDTDTYRDKDSDSVRKRKRKRVCV